MMMIKDNGSYLLSVSDQRRYTVAYRDAKAASKNIGAKSNYLSDIFCLLWGKEEGHWVDE